MTQQQYYDPAPQVGQIGPNEPEAPYVANFKSSGGYDAAMLTIRASTAAEHADRIGAAKAVNLGAVMGEFDAEFKATFSAGSGLGATPVQAPAAAQQQYQQQQPAQQYAQPPQGGYQQPQQGYQQADPNAPTCMHGVKKFVQGTNTQGKPYKFWGCPAPKNDPGQCKPQWIN